MIPVGYMAMHICSRPGESFKAPNVVDIYSECGCISEHFVVDYIQFWKHNGYWLFDSPEIIRTIAKENSIDLRGTSLFYYEAFEQEFTGEVWRSFSPDTSFQTSIVPPLNKDLKGFDVVTMQTGHSPGHSPLSCNGLADDLPTNSHCLFDSFNGAETSLTAGKFVKCEPGPYRIFAVYSVDWP